MVNVCNKCNNIKSRKTHRLQFNYLIEIKTFNKTQQQLTTTIITNNTNNIKHNNTNRKHYNYVRLSSINKIIE